MDSSVRKGEPASAAGCERPKNPARAGPSPPPNIGLSLFKKLPARLQAKHGSLGTAQAILGRLDELPFDRKPPMTVRTIQADIKFMREDGNFGI